MEVVITRRQANGVILNAESGDGRFYWFGCEPDVVYDRTLSRKVYCAGNPPRRPGRPEAKAPPEEVVQLARVFHDILMPIVQACWRRHEQQVRSGTAVCAEDLHFALT